MWSLHALAKSLMRIVENPMNKTAVIAKLAIIAASFIVYILLGGSFSK
tara:strand:- start:294 stop:437 length:144 start_codon:yes stop_codon:yes gene_type:complete